MATVRISSRSSSRPKCIGILIHNIQVYNDLHCTNINVKVYTNKYNTLYSSTLSIESATNTKSLFLFQKLLYPRNHNKTIIYKVIVHHAWNNYSYYTANKCKYVHIDCILVNTMQYGSQLYFVIMYAWMIVSHITNKHIYMLW